MKCWAGSSGHQGLAGDVQTLGPKKGLAQWKDRFNQKDKLARSPQICSTAHEANMVGESFRATDRAGCALILGAERLLPIRWTKHRSPAY